MTEVTSEDREKADAIVANIYPKPEPWSAIQTAEDIAQALADERARADDPADTRLMDFDMHETSYATLKEN